MYRTIGIALLVSLGYISCGPETPAPVEKKLDFNSSEKNQISAMDWKNYGGFPAPQSLVTNIYHPASQEVYLFNRNIYDNSLNFRTLKENGQWINCASITSTADFHPYIDPLNELVSLVYGTPIPGDSSEENGIQKNSPSIGILSTYYANPCGPSNILKLTENYHVFSVFSSRNANKSFLYAGVLGKDFKVTTSAYWEKEASFFSSNGTLITSPASVDDDLGNMINIGLGKSAIWYQVVNPSGVASSTWTRITDSFDIATSDDTKKSIQFSYTTPYLLKAKSYNGKIYVFITTEDQKAYYLTLVRKSNSTEAPVELSIHQKWTPIFDGIIASGSTSYSSGYAPIPFIDTDGNLNVIIQGIKNNHSGIFLIQLNNPQNIIMIGDSSSSPIQSDLTVLPISPGNKDPYIFGTSKNAVWGTPIR